VLIDWKSGLDLAIFVHYSTPSGDKLIHRAPNPVFMPNYPGWGFHKFNPWRERFDQVIRWTLEAGLVEHWKQRTQVRLKQESVNAPITPTERGTPEPLTLGNLQGAFFLWFLLFAASIIAIWFEGLGHMVRKAFNNAAAKSKDRREQGLRISLTDNSLQQPTRRLCFSQEGSSEQKINICGPRVVKGERISPSFSYMPPLPPTRPTLDDSNCTKY
jgi:hypothetical protein